MDKEIEAGGGKTRSVFREVQFLALAAVTLFLALALLSFDPADPGWSVASDRAPQNKGGFFGAWLADVILYLCGYSGYLLPLAIAWLCWRVWVSEFRLSLLMLPEFATRFGGLTIFFAGACALGSQYFEAGPLLPQYAGGGGIVGSLIQGALVKPLGLIGYTVLMLALLLTGVTLYTRFSWVDLMDRIGHLVLRLPEGARMLVVRIVDFWVGLQARRWRERELHDERQRQRERVPPMIGELTQTIEAGAREREEKQQELFAPPPEVAMPALDLLDAPEDSSYSCDSQEALEAMSRQVEVKLRDFGVEAQVVAVEPGPVITRFELQPAPGVKGSQVSNLAKDLARSLSVVSVRVVEVIPGKSVLGLEIPNERRERVNLRELLGSREFEESSSPLSLALGKDIGGRPVVMELDRMPHVLVAGTTGSGKSVALNAMILSLLYRAPATELRLIMIDPKMLELSVYEGIPHLLAPVVTDMKQASSALRWCVGEMERRYRLMATLGVRNVSGYNRRLIEAQRQGEALFDPAHPGADSGVEPSPLMPLPYVVVVIDELADLMMVTGKKIEELVARLAQKARAAGIHLVLATQRPSVDVLTGLIKANIPARIAFQVSARVDSRTILDQMGAETLLGHGDMLFLPPGNAVPIRVHGAYVDDKEVQRVTEKLRLGAEPDYDETVLQEPAVGEPTIPGLQREAGDADPLYDEAVRIVAESRRASISYVQRRLKIGYNRAARLVEEMEREGVVGPVEANGSREILVSPPPEVE